MIWRRYVDRLIMLTGSANMLLRRVCGIEPVNFLNLDQLQLHAYVENLIEQMGSHRYILANSDSCPPGVTLEKFLMIAEMVRANPI